MPKYNILDGGKQQTQICASVAWCRIAGQDTRDTVEQTKKHMSSKKQQSLSNLTIKLLKLTPWKKKKEKKKYSVPTDMNAFDHVSGPRAFSFPQCPSGGCCHFRSKGC